MSSGRSDLDVSGDDELRPVTSLFADVVGSTSLGERLSPAEIKTLIGECVSRMCEAIENCGGCVRSYMGDGIAGFFGIDGAREDDNERAAHAALEIQRLAAAYSSEVEDAWGVSDFNVRIGINAGRVAVGNVGAADPQRVALGDSVNVAARLQSAASPGSIVLGAAVAETIGDRFDVRPLGDFFVKGRDAGVQAFELEAEKGVPISAMGAPFVGRAAELVLLHGAVADLSKGRGQLCFVHGDGGVGKTRLIEELRRGIPEGIAWLAGRCDAMDHRSPYAPFVQALRCWLSLDQRSSPIETRVRLRARGEEVLGEDFDLCAPYLARLLGVDAGTQLGHRVEGLPSEVLVSGLTTSYLTWLGAVAGASPVVIAIDNFGAASDSTVELCEALIPALEGSSVLLLLTMRSNAESSAQRLPFRAMTELPNRCVEIKLGSLGPHESRALVADLDQEMTLNSRLRELIVERAEGNPLFIEELVAAMTSGSETTRGALETLPGALERLLLARIDRLPVAARGVLQAAAVVGRTFRKELVGLMSGEEVVRDALPVLLRADLIRESGREPIEFVFRHGLIREAALSTLTHPRIRALNATAADALLMCSDFDMDRDAEALASYRLAADDVPGAVKYLEHVADRLASVFRWSDASDVLSRCVGQLRESEDEGAFARVAQKQATFMSALGHFEASIALMDELLQRDQAWPTREAVIIAKARYLVGLGKADAADELLRCIEVNGDRTATSMNVLTLRGQLALGRGDVRAAEDCLEVLGDVEALPPVAGFEAASLMAGVLASKCEFGTAETWALRAQSLAERTGQVSSMLTARRHVGLICLLKGYVREAYPIALSVYEECGRLGYQVGRLEAAVTLTHIGIQSGALEEVGRIAEDLLAEDPGPLWSGLLNINLACVRGEQGRYADCMALAKRVLETPEEFPSWVSSACHVAIGSAASGLGNDSLAEEELELAQEIVARDGSPQEQAHIATGIAYLLMMKGELGAAKQWADKALSAIEWMEPAGVSYVRRVHALVTRSEDLDVSVENLRSLLVESEKTGLRMEEARLCIALGVLESSGSAEFFARAQRIFEECGCGRGLDELKVAMQGDVGAFV